MPDNEGALVNAQVLSKQILAQSNSLATLLTIHKVTEQPEPETSAIAEDPGSFPKHYVLQLRDENAKYRVRSRWADEFDQRLPLELVCATGRLADPAGPPLERKYLQNPGAFTQTIDNLLQRKPHVSLTKANPQNRAWSCNLERYRRPGRNLAATSAIGSDAIYEGDDYRGDRGSGGDRGCCAGECRRCT